MADSINKVSDIIDQVSKECINKKSDKLIETYRI